MAEAPTSITIGTKTAFVHAGKNKDLAFVIGHGASGDADSGNLPKIADWLVSKAGITVVRYNAGGPLKSRTAILNALLAIEEGILSQVKTWILSGHSMGGRAACAVATAKPGNVAAVVLFSYPLHPPGKQTELRDTDLTALTCPVLIIRGSKDTFSTEPTFSEVMKRMSSKNLQIEMSEGGDHSLNTKTGPAQKRFEAFMEKVQSFVTELAVEASNKKPKTSARASTSDEDKTGKAGKAGAGKQKAPKEKAKPRAAAAGSEKANDKKSGKATDSTNKRKNSGQEASAKSKKKKK